MNINNAAIALGCGKQNFYVTASIHKKRHGEYPCWYKTEGVSGRKDSVEIDVKYILALREEVTRIHFESGEMYFTVRDKLGTDTAIANALVEHSSWDSSFHSWMSFMHRDLFKEPIVRFEDRHHKLREFHRVLKGLV